MLIITPVLFFNIYNYSSSPRLPWHRTTYQRPWKERAVLSQLWSQILSRLEQGCSAGPGQVSAGQGQRGQERGQSSAGPRGSALASQVLASQMLFRVVSEPTFLFGGDSYIGEAAVLQEFQLMNICTDLISRQGHCRRHQYQAISARIGVGAALL